MRMFRNLLLLVIVAAAAVWLINTFYQGRATERPPGALADPEVARERAAQVGEKVAQAVNVVGAAVDDATLTAKIKAKLALDDLVKARNIDVDTRTAVVTLRGVVHSEAERKRAVELAEQTEDVREVKVELELRQ